MRAFRFPVFGASLCAVVRADGRVGAVPGPAGLLGEFGPPCADGEAGVNFVSKTAPPDGEATPGGADLDAFLGLSDRPNRWRWVAAGALILAIAALLAWTLVARPQPPEQLSWQPAQRGDLVVSVAATGNLAPTDEVQVGSELSGLIAQVLVRNNDRVLRGQPLARLDTARLQDAMRQAQAALAAARADEALAAATATQAHANLDRYEQVFRLSHGNVPSRVDLEARRADDARARADVGARHAQVAGAQAQLSEALTNLAKATIRSPVTGVVLSTDVRPGQTVAASFQAPVLFRIANDLSRMQLEVAVDEADVGGVREGQAARFSVDAFPNRQFDARIVRVDLGASATDTPRAPNAGSGGRIISYAAILDVDNADLVLRPGMTATATIVTERRGNALLVPLAAFRFGPGRFSSARKGGGGLPGILAGRRRASPERNVVSVGRGSHQILYVRGKDGHPLERRVLVGARSGAQAEIVGGDLKAGEEVLVAAGPRADGAGRG